MARSSQALTAIIAFTILPWTGQLLDAQTKKKGESITGTVVSIEKAKTGRSYSMKIKTKSDEAEYDVSIVPRTQLTVTAQGDEGFFKPGANVGGKIVPLDNPGEFTDAELFVYVDASPPPQLRKLVNPNDPDDDTYEMSGKLMAVQGEVAQIQCGTQLIKVSFSGGKPTPMVKSSSAALIKEGDAVEIEGTIIKGKQTITANSIVVTATEPITAADYFATQGEKGKSAKTAVSKAKAKKDATAESASKEADPFGVLGNKPKTKTKTSGGSATPAGKEPDPFGVLKNKAKTKAKSSSAAESEMEEPETGKPAGKKPLKGTKSAKATEEPAESKE